MGEFIMPIKDESSGAMLGRSLGKGLGKGIAGLIENQHNEIKEKKLVDMFQKNGFDKESSKLLAWVAQNNPEQFNTILSLIASDNKQHEAQIMRDRLALQRTAIYAGSILLFCVLILVAYRVFKK
jgi:hypothetical protein